MSYLPTPGSNIAQLYECISEKKQTNVEIINRVRLKHPNFPIPSASIHLRYLIKKKLVIKRNKLFSRNIKNVKIANNVSTAKISKSQCVLQYCKQKIGKKVTSKELVKHCCDRPNDTAPSTALNGLKAMGVVSRIEGTSPYEYLILPEIKIIDNIRTTLPAIKTQKTIERIEPKDNIADLSIDQILTEYVSLKDENRRLKEAMQRIAHELFQVGEVEK